MAYTINKTNGSVFATIADGTVDTSSSISIIGRNYSGYGEFLGENFIKMLENSANSAAPGSPLEGQLWYDSANNILKVHNATEFKQLANVTVGTSEPSTSLVSGDLFYKTSTQQLFAYDGSNFELIGPTIGSSILSGDLDLDGNDITGTGDINITGTVTASGGFSGTASDASQLGGVAAANYLRSNANDTTSGTLGILNDSGLAVGADSDLTLTVSSSDVTIANATTNGDMIFSVNDGGTPTTAMTIDGATSLVTVANDPTASLGVATKQYVDSAISGGGSAALLRDGSTSVTGDILPDTTNIRDLGSSTKVFQEVHATTFYGQSTSAQYADVAERFHAGYELEEGTVVELGGKYEITEVMEELTDNVFGVVSTRPAHLMNATAGTDETHPAVALNGRVPVKVTGRVKKGDRLVSAGNGIARAATAKEATAFNVLGRALEDKDNDMLGTVEAIVKVN